MGTIYKTFDVALELKQTSTNAPFYVIEGDNGNKICLYVSFFSSSCDDSSLYHSPPAGGPVARPLPTK